MTVIDFQSYKNSLSEGKEKNMSKFRKTIGEYHTAIQEQYLENESEIQGQYEANQRQYEANKKLRNRRK
jgi:hypothetical protein